MIKKHLSAKNCIWYVTCLSLLFLSALAVGRSLFIGLDIDEQYAVTLAYRMAMGDRMLRDLWEPHQTSAILPAILVKLYLLIKGDNSYLLLYLRGIGILLQGGISFLWYQTLKQDFGKKPALLTALILFHTLPKWIVTPEFANQQLWFFVLTILCFYRYAKEPKLRYLFYGGISTCFLVLAYPSSVLLFLFYVLWLIRRDYKATALYLFVCAAGAGIFLGYLLSYLSFSDIVLSLQKVFADPTHPMSPIDKLLGYLRDLFVSLPSLLLYSVIAALFTLLCKLVKPLQEKAFLQIFYPMMLLLALVDQVRLWAFSLAPAIHPQLHYLLLYLWGGILYTSIKKEKPKSFSTLFQLAWLPSLLGLFSVLLLTNLDLKASFVHLLPGMLLAFLYYCNFSASDITPNSFSSKVLLLPILWVTILIGARGYLIRVSGGFPENAFLVKQKALSGVALNVYCPYMEGYEYNANALALEENIAPGTKILYIGQDMLFTYLMNDAVIACPTTISTPVYDSRYLEYYTLHPNKEPEVLVIDKDYFENQEFITDDFLEWILLNYNWESKITTEFLWIVEK